MTIKFTPPREAPDLKPRITVIGAGGGGCNAVNNMIRANLEGVEFIIANSDAQAIEQSLAERKIQLGPSITQGLGAGSRPEIGRAAAEESMDEIVDHLQGTHMAFITVGLGGGTGTGAAPVIAQAARDMGILTVAVATKPFHFEGARRMEHAEQGLAELEQYVDTLIVIPNQNLFRVANEKTTFADAFKMADDVLYAGVRGVTDLMVMPGLINLDFADIRTVMSEMGKAMMGTGEAEGDTRALDAAESAISNPLLDDISMRGARGVLINITGGMDMTLFEVDEAANRIRDEVDSDANIIFGSTFDADLEGRMRVSVVATGINSEAAVQPKPQATAQERRMYTGPKSTYGAPETQSKNFAQAKPATSFYSAPKASATAAAAMTSPTPQTTSAPTETFSTSEVDLADADSFVPPEPMAGPEDYEEPTGNPDPFATADVENSTKETPTPSHTPMEEGKSPSLFERMSSGFSSKPKGKESAAPSETSSDSDGQQPRLQPVTPLEQPQDSQSGEEDLLEIPAFLRRQVN
jgi:cell division protein FtsZ